MRFQGPQVHQFNMPFIQRQVIGTGNGSRTDAPITWVLDGAELNRASPVQWIDIALPANTVLNSIRQVINTQLTDVGPYTFSSITPSIPVRMPPTILNGFWVLQVEDWFNQKWFNNLLGGSFTGAGVEVSPADLSGFQHGTKPIGKLPTPLWKFPDGSIHYILTIIRGFFRTIVPTFINHVVVWYPYNTNVQVTGLVTSQFQDQPQVLNPAVCITDLTSQSLYGVRPAQNDVQSDFVETQTQSVRVAENIIWQANMVLKDTFQIVYNPAIKRGQTIRLQHASKNIDHLGIVKNVGHTFDPQTGKATTQVELRCTEYIFRSALADRTEHVDQRQDS